MKKSLYSSCIALILVVALLVNGPLKTIATGVMPEYISDMRIGYSQDKSQKGKEEAKKSLTDAGYKVLDYDLNSGTGKGWSYIGYKTTRNKAEAITDLAMMDMNGGYEMSNYASVLEKSKSNIEGLAEKMSAAVAEFKVNYSEGSPAAKVAMKALNFIFVPEANKQKLGNYFMDQSRVTNDYYEIILKCHPDILSLIYMQLALGTVDKGQNNWLDRLSKADPYADYDDNVYYDKAKPIYDSINSSAKKHAEAQVASDNGVKLDSEQMMILSVYEVLNQYEYDGTGIGDYLLNPDSNVIDFYPLVASLTQGQLGMMEMVGVESFVMNLQNTEDSYIEGYKIIEKQYSAVGGCSLWEGVDRDAFGKDVAITDEANREMAAKNDFSALTKTDTLSDTLKNAIKVVGVIASVAAGLACFAFIGVSFAVGGSITIATLFSAISTSFTASVMGAVSSVVLSASMAIAILALVVIIVLAFVLLAFEIKKAWDYYHPTYTAIPPLMYDVSENGSGESVYLRYEAVLDQNGKPGDLNTWQGREWNALYYTKDAKAGTPITTDFIVQYTDGITPAGYSPLHMFGEVIAANTNKHTYKDNNGGIYVFFKHDGSNVKTGGINYLSDIVVESGKSEEEARNKILAKGYQVLNFNLVMNNGHDSKYAFLGYKTTNSKSRAICDIRVAYKYDVGQIYLGDSSYGKAGKVNDVTFYYSKMVSSGVPILSQFYSSLSMSDDIPSGFEPVCLISGGPAFNINTANRESQNYPSYLYFMPSETFTSGTKYVSGITFFSSPQAKFANQYLTEMGYTNTKHDMMVNSGHAEVVYMGYSESYNPYRALRKMVVFNSADNKAMLLGNASFGSIGYAAAPTFTYYEEMKYGFDIYGFRDTYSYITDKGDYAWGEQSTALYLTSGTSQGVPFKYSDMVFSDTPLASNPTGYVAVSHAMDYTFKAADLKKGAGSNSFLYLYLPGSNTVKKYISSIVIGSSESSNELARLSLLASGCEDALSKDYKSYYWDSKTKFHDYYSKIGIIRTNDVNRAITGVKVLVWRNKDKTPPQTMSCDGITYTIASTDPYVFCDDSQSIVSLHRLEIAAYIYTTTNISAGSPLTSISQRDTFFSDKLENAEIIESRDFDMSGPYKNWDLSYDEFKITIDIDRLYMIREEEDKYVYNIDAMGSNFGKERIINGLSAMGNSNFVDFDFDVNLDSSLNNYKIYMAYTKTSKSTKAITNLIAVYGGDKPSESVVKDGITYYLAFGGFNFNDKDSKVKIYLYYTRDSSAGSPITEISGSINRNISDREIVLDSNGGIANLNYGRYDGCSGDSITPVYMYLKRANSLIDHKPSFVGSVFSPSSPFSIVVIAFFMVGIGGCAIVGQALRKKKRKESE